MKKPISQREFAKRIGVNHSAVAKAIESGRLAASLCYVGGTAKIQNLPLAKKEWRASSQPRASDGAAPVGDRGLPDYRRERARRERALADLAEIERDEQAGKFVLVAEARDTIIGAFTQVRTKLLGLLAIRASILTGTLARTNECPAPTEEESREIGRLTVKALTHLIIGMRSPDALPPSQEELSAVLQGLALGCLEKVMGLVPSDDPTLDPATAN